VTLAGRVGTFFESLSELMNVSTVESPSATKSIVIVTPVYNDWEALASLLPLIDRSLSQKRIRVKVLVIDDGSSTLPDDQLLRTEDYQSISQVEVLELRRNLGHQRAITIGLAYVEAYESCETIIVMDSDGEDEPSDILEMIKTFDDEGGRKIVFAERTQRSESIVFQIFYLFYRFAYRLLTGRNVRFGNFSVLPRRCLSSLVAVSEMWNHYVAAILKSRQPFTVVPTKRGKRLHGQPKMNFISLVVHGLSAISVDSDTVGVRLLMISLMLIAISLVLLVVIILIRISTNLAIPGWATTAAGLVATFLFQAITLAVTFSFITLSGRNGSFFLPKRDYIYFVSRTYNLWPIAWGQEKGSGTVL
jgi:glycosyltransferase involved in cell wall biosynthesis